MPNLDITEEEARGVVAFLKWMSSIDTNGFPATPPLQEHLAPAPSRSEQPLLFTQTCSACHTVGGQGGHIGPALDGIGDRLDEDYLGRWLSDPTSVRPDTTMPDLGLSDEQVQELVTYLSTLRTEG